MDTRPSDARLPGTGNTRTTETDTATDTGTATGTDARDGRGDAATAVPAPVAVLGLGALGAALTRAFLRAGHPTTVWNRTPAKLRPLVDAGATAAASAADAALAAPLVVVCVSTPDDTRSVLGPTVAAGALAASTVVNLGSGTPDDARALAAWLAEHGVEHLDGAAMSGTRAVGDPTALFLYGGPAPVFAGARATLAALGRAVHVGTDPGTTSLYDVALLTVNLGLLTGFYHAAALGGAGGVDPVELATVATDYLPFAVGLVGDHARQIRDGRFPDDDGTLDVYAAAVEHVIGTSRRLGLATDVPTAAGELLRRAIDAGHGADGLARLATTIGGAG
jgi:3-hydroxyisobutyrate dehydrogenase-like beta-hydroxyacid dehydrogenase